MEVWPPLPQSLEEEIAAQEADRRHIPQARAVLERALICQFQAIAEGLLADRVLTEKAKDINFRTWVAQYLSQRDPGEAERWGTRKSEDDTDGTGTGDMADAIRKMATAFLANHPPAIEEYRQAFYEGVNLKHAKRVHPEELTGMSVSIYGGRAPVWQEGRINAQLAKLGSDLRLYIASADVLRTADLMAKLGAPPKEPPVISEFLLGVARPCTSAFKAQLFEFDHEYAVSPYLHADSPGLVDQCRIVFRHRFYHGIVMNHPANSVIAEGMADPILRGHEQGHILNTYGFVVSGHFAAWRPVMRSDICRFAREPKKYGEIYLAFHRTFDEFEMAPKLAMGLLPSDEPKDKLKLTDIIGELVADELLQRTKDEKVVCHQFDDGRAWSIE